MSKTQATLIGMIAIILWSSIVALIKSVSLSFGSVGGAALTYTLASIFLLFTFGMTNFRGFPKKYLIFGTILFVSYELCLALSIGYAQNPRQAIEVGMVNYLWPTFTIVGSILFNNQRANWVVIPGFILSIVGITWVLGNGQGINIALMMENIKANPFSYILAFVGAIIWTTYCVITAKFAKGKNGITFFFIMVAVTLWAQYLILYGFTNTFDINFKSMMYLLLSASALGFGYAAWNIGVLHGNMLVLATASYFIPVLSAAIAALILSTTLELGFWKGVIMICLGSLCCFIATRQKN